MTGSKPRCDGLKERITRVRGHVEREATQQMAESRAITEQHEHRKRLLRTLRAAESAQVGGGENRFLLDDWAAAIIEAADEFREHFGEDSGDLLRRLPGRKEQNGGTLQMREIFTAVVEEEISPDEVAAVLEEAIDFLEPDNLKAPPIKSLSGLRDYFDDLAAAVEQHWARSNVEVVDRFPDQIARIRARLNPEKAERVIAVFERVAADTREWIPTASMHSYGVHRTTLDRPFKNKGAPEDSKGGGSSNGRRFYRREALLFKFLTEWWTPQDVGT